MRPRIMQGAFQWGKEAHRRPIHCSFAIKEEEEMNWYIMPVKITFGHMPLFAELELEQEYLTQAGL